MKKNLDPRAKKGLRIKLVKMADDPRPVEDDMEGTIHHIDGMGTIHVTWDNGRNLGVVPGEDDYILYPPKEEVIDDIDDLFNEANLSSSSKDKSAINKSMPKPTLRGSKSTQAGKNVTKNWKSSLSKTKPKVRDIKVEEEEIEETTMAGGGASTGAFVGPLGGEDVVKKKGIYEPKTESRIIKVKDFLNEVNSIESARLRSDGTYDGNAWVGDKDNDGWEHNDTPAWEGGEIVDILAKLKINWKDSNLTVDTIKEAVKNHCGNHIGDDTPIEEEEELDETTTFSSVWGSNGPPVTPMFAAPKGKHRPSKKPIWKDGKIVQKIKNSGIMAEENDIKYVKGGKFVKIKDKCAKFDNQPWCNSGNDSNPLELSDTTFKNIEEISKKTGISEQDIINRLRFKVNK
jgi:hypothetical protein